MPSAPDCEANPIFPRTGWNGAKVAFIEMSGAVLTTPMPLGPTRRIPWSRASSTSSSSTCAPPLSAKPALMTMRPCTPFPAHSRTMSATDSRGNGDDREIDVVGHVEDGRIGADAGHRGRVRVDRVHRTGEVAGQQVPEHLVADRPRAAAGPDHRDGAGREQPPDGARLRDLLPLVLHGLGRVGRVDGERHVHDAVGELAHDLEPRVAEHAEHAAVVGQRLGGEPPDAMGAPHRGQMLEQDRGEPASLLVVLHGERDFGLFGRGRAVVARDCDDLIAELGDECHPVLVVDVREVLELLRGR